MPFCVMPARSLASISRMRDWRTFESHGAAQIFRFASAKVGGDHGDAQQLFLKKWDAECALEHGFERRMGIRDFFASLAAQNEGIHHLADDGTGDE